MHSKHNYFLRWHALKELLALAPFGQQGLNSLPKDHVIFQHFQSVKKLNTIKRKLNTYWQRGRFNPDELEAVSDDEPEDAIPDVSGMLDLPQNTNSEPTPQPSTWGSFSHNSLWMIGRSELLQFHYVVPLLKMIWLRKMTPIIGLTEPWVLLLSWWTASNPGPVNWILLIIWPNLIHIIWPDSAHINQCFLPPVWGFTWQNQFTLRMRCRKRFPLPANLIWN